MYKALISFSYETITLTIWYWCVSMSLSKLVFEPFPMRTVTRKMIKRFNLGSYISRLKIGAVDRPHYAYCMYNGALLAKKLGYSGISVLEFGVAGGRGLLDLEHHAQKISKFLSIKIDIYGFDTGEGLPEPIDYRDLPYHWEKGFYKMDVPRLQKKLKNAKLVLGDVRKTAETFLEKYKPLPIGAVMFDLDFYSSTAAALKIFGGAEKYFLPRLCCYFDDVRGNETVLYNDYTGARLAINEFNDAYAKMKLTKPYHLLTQKVVDPWQHKIWVFHNFEHSKYNRFVSKKHQQLSI